MLEQKIGEENLKNVNLAIVLDCDGVITDPEQKRITTPGLAAEIAAKINQGSVVAINTGRSLEWLLTRNVMGAIEEEVDDRDKLSDVIAVGEKGGTWLTYEDGNWKTHVDRSIQMPENLRATVRNLIGSEFAGGMFFDESKLTMISTEMIDGRKVDDYKKRQPALVERMRSIIKRPQFAHLNLIIDPTTIATDIQHKHVGKHFGARRIEAFLKARGLKPEHVVTVGDSQSDTEMAEELQQRFPTDFVFVGNPKDLKADKLARPPIFTKARFGEGTLEYLRSI